MGWQRAVRVCGKILVYLPTWTLQNWKQIQYNIHNNMVPDLKFLILRFNHEATGHSNALPTKKYECVVSNQLFQGWDASPNWVPDGLNADGHFFRVTYCLHDSGLAAALKRNGPKRVMQPLRLSTQTGKVSSFPPFFHWLIALNSNDKSSFWYGLVRHRNGR